MLGFNHLIAFLPLLNLLHFYQMQVPAAGHLAGKLGIDRAAVWQLKRSPAYPFVLRFLLFGKKLKTRPFLLVLALLVLGALARHVLEQIRIYHNTTSPAMAAVCVCVRYRARVYVSSFLFLFFCGG